MIECVGKKVSYVRVMNSSIGRAGTSGANVNAGSAGSAGSTRSTGTTERQAGTHIRVLVWNRFFNLDFATISLVHVNRHLSHLELVHFHSMDCNVIVGVIVAAIEAAMQRVPPFI